MKPAAAAALRALRAVNDVTSRLLRLLVTALASVMLASVLLAVFTRVAFRHSPPWSEEVALLTFGWIILLMTAAGVRDFSHARLDSLLKLLPDAARRAADRLIALLIVGVGLYLLWAGCDYLVEMGGSRSAAMRYPMEILYASLPVASALIALYGGERVIAGPPADARA